MTRVKRRAKDDRCFAATMDKAAAKIKYGFRELKADCPAIAMRRGS